MENHRFNSTTGKLVNDYCSNCGKPLVANAKFCSYCGVEVNNSDDPTLEETLEWLKGYIEGHGGWRWIHTEESHHGYSVDNRPEITSFNSSYSVSTNFETLNNKIVITIRTDYYDGIYSYRGKTEHKNLDIRKYSFSLLDIVGCFVNEPSNFTEISDDFDGVSNRRKFSTPENGVVFPITLRCKSMKPLINLTEEKTYNLKKTDPYGNPMPGKHRKDEPKKNKVSEIQIEIDDEDIAKRICKALNHAIKIAGGNLREPF